MGQCVPIPRFLTRIPHGAFGYNCGYTAVMKTAVSLPDDLFRLAESTARRLRVSRSELYAKAIAAFLQAKDESAITERLNDVYSRNPAKLRFRAARRPIEISPPGSLVKWTRFSAGEVWWADLPQPRRSEPGYRRPVLVVQADSFNPKPDSNSNRSRDHHELGTS